MFDLVIVGMGSAGLTAAEFASGLGLQVAVVERGRVGGDCLWTGCVPSKALLAAAKAAHQMRTADRLGLEPVEPVIHLAKVWRRVRAVQAQIAATDDNPQRYRDLGAEIVFGGATLTGANQVTVHTADDAARVLDTRFVLVATGSRPHMPDIDGLSADECLTNENLFELDEPPASLAVIGGGPMGVETAQALQRLGVPVTIFQRARTLLPREEPVLVDRLTAALQGEGVAVHCSADVRRVERRSDGSYAIVATVGDDGREVTLVAGGVLVAAGRTPNTDGLGLAELGIGVGTGGVESDSRGRTAVRSVYVAGDVAGRRMLTNVAGAEAVTAVRDMFFPGKGSAADVVPWCTFTDPELARAGLTIDEAEQVHGADTDVWRIDLDHNDRARAEGRADGCIIVVTAKGRVVGAHVLAPGAGEVIHELALAVRQQMRLDDLASLVHVYPTLSTSIGQLATEAAYEKAQRLRWLMKRR